jgi:fructokinase
MDLYAIGEVVIDFIPGKEKRSYIANAGGAPANVAIAMARNGFSAGVCCSVGEDDFGHFLMKTLKENGIRILNPAYCTKAVTTMAFVSLDENNDRSFTFARKPGADMFIEPEFVKEEDIRDSVLVHAGSCSLSAQPAREATKRALMLGARNGKMVSFDINYRNLMWNDDRDACADAVFEILPFVDLLKISEEEAVMLGGEERIPEVMARQKIAVTVETLGSEGSLAYFAGKEIRVKGKKVHAADTTGAGDAFWGGFLSGLRLQGIEHAGQLTEETVRRAMRYGSASGTICCQHMGAIDSLPTRREIEEALAEEENEDA